MERDEIEIAKGRLWYGLLLGRTGGGGAPAAWPAECGCDGPSTPIKPFSSTQNLKKCYSTCYIECLRPIHRALNIDEKKLIAQFGGKLRDERFEPN